MLPIDSYGVRVIEFAAILFEFDYYLNFTFGKLITRCFVRQTRKLKALSYAVIHFELPRAEAFGYVQLLSGHAFFPGATFDLFAALSDIFHFSSQTASFQL